MKYKKEEFIIACRSNTVITCLKVFVKKETVLWESLKSYVWPLMLGVMLAVPTYATVVTGSQSDVNMELK